MATKYNNGNIDNKREQLAKEQKELMRNAADEEDKVNPYQKMVQENTQKANPSFSGINSVKQNDVQAADRYIKSSSDKPAASKKESTIHVSSDNDDKNKNNPAHSRAYQSTKDTSNDYAAGRTGLGAAQQKWDQDMRNVHENMHLDSEPGNKYANPVKHNSAASNDNKSTASKQDPYKNHNTSGSGSFKQPKNHSFIHNNSSSNPNQNNRQDEKPVKKEEDVSRHAYSGKQEKPPVTIRRNDGRTVDYTPKTKYQKTDNYMQNAQGAGHSGIFDAQAEYDMRMRGILPGDEKSETDNAINEKFKNQLHTNRDVNYDKTSVVSCGNRGKSEKVTAGSGIRIASQADSGILKNARFTSKEQPANNIRTTSDENNVNNHGIRATSDPVKHSWIKSEDTIENSSLKTRESVSSKDGNRQPDNTANIKASNKQNINLSPLSVNASKKAGEQWKMSYNKRVAFASGVHIVGGKTKRGYSSSGSDAIYGTGAVLTNYQSIFSDPVLAEKCGVLYDPENQKFDEITVANGKAGKISEMTIVDELVARGYAHNDAFKIAHDTMEAISGDTVDFNSTLSHNDNFSVDLHNASGQIDENTKIQVKKSGDKFIIYKPIGMTKTDIGIKVEKPMRRFTSTAHHYLSGVAQQSTDEAGRGFANTERAVRVASLLLPSVALHVKNQFHRELNAHLEGFVVFSAGKGKGDFQWTVGEMKHHLTKQLGFSEDLVNTCVRGGDFSFWAKKLLKDDAKLPVADRQLTWRQFEFLNTIADARTATTYDRIKAVNSVLRKYDINFTEDYGHFAVQRIEAEIKKAKKIYGNNVPEDLKAALLEKKFIAEKRVYDSVNGSKKIMKVMMIARGTLEKNGSEAGRGLSVTARAANITKMAVVSYVKVLWMKNVVVREAAQKAALLAAKGMLAAAKGANAVGFTKAASKISKAGHKTLGASKKMKDMNRKINSTVRNAKYNTKSWAKDHNPLRKAKNKLKDKLKSTNAYKKFTNNKAVQAISKAFGGFGKFWSAVGKIKAAITKYLMIAGAILLLIIFIVLLINTIAASVGALFNANSQEYDTKQYLAKTLQECWEEDMKAIQEQVEALGGSYDTDNPHNTYVENIEVTFEDYKHYSKKDCENDSDMDKNEYWMNYEDMASDHESYNFIQSSNFGEILSMALIRYDYDLGTLKDKWFSDEPKKSKQFEAVEEYVKQLYYGSHQLIINTEEQAHASDDIKDGETVEAPDGEAYNYSTYKVKATYKTYYFNYLFNCELATSPQRDISAASNTGSATGFAQSWDSVYYALRKAGISHNGAAAIMSNMAHETGDRNNWQATDGPNPTLGKPNGKGAYGICQWTSSGNRKAKMIAWCESKGQDPHSTSGQIAFMLHELDGYGSLYSMLKNKSKPAYELGNAFGDIFERYHGHSPDGTYTDGNCGNSGCEHTSRGGLAEKIAEYYAKPDKAGENGKDWEKMMSVGEIIAQSILAYEGTIHYTQGGALSTDIGTRISPDNGTLAKCQEGFSSKSCGTDCSAFVQLAYKEFAGITGIPGTTKNYPGCALKKLPKSQALPGDIAWKEGHVEIYVGDGKTFGAHKCYRASGGCQKDLGYSGYGTSALSHFDCVYRPWS